jgi:hypothetical protein
MVFISITFLFPLLPLPRFMNTAPALKIDRQTGSGNDVDRVIHALLF